MKRPDPALVVVLAGISAALHIGKLPPALPVLRETLHITLVQAGFLLSLVQVAGMTLGLAIGAAADALGPRRTMVLGLVVLSLASLLGGARGRASCSPPCPRRA
jgi:MFS family permease